MSRRRSRPPRSKDTPANPPDAAEGSPVSPSETPPAADPGTECPAPASVEPCLPPITDPAELVSSEPACDNAGTASVEAATADGIVAELPAGTGTLEGGGVPAIGADDSGDVATPEGGMPSEGAVEVAADATTPTATPEAEAVEESSGGSAISEAPLELKFVLESLLFAAQKALTPKELRDQLVLAAQDEEAPEAGAYKKTKEHEILEALEALRTDHEAAGRSYRLMCVAGAWQFACVPRYAPWLRALLGRKARPPRLSQPGIETLTIIAYRQPVTRAEIEQIRGVSVDGVMTTLLERGLIEAVGRAEVIGRPVTYGTTPLFLEYFGLRALEDLPAAEELRRIPVQKPEALLTVDPGLATAPAEPPAAPVELPLVDPAAAGTESKPEG